MVQSACIVHRFPFDVFHLLLDYELCADGAFDSLSRIGLMLYLTPQMVSRCRLIRAWHIAHSITMPSESGIFSTSKYFHTQLVRMAPSPEVDICDEASDCELGSELLTLIRSFVLSSGYGGTKFDQICCEFIFYFIYDVILHYSITVQWELLFTHPLLMKFTHRHFDWVCLARSRDRRRQFWERHRVIVTTINVRHFSPV